MNNNTLLPVEILDIIIEDLIAQLNIRDYTHAFLAPLLRVCKLWHTVSEKHLYRRISFGMHISSQNKMTGVGFEVVKDLLATLETNPRLATLVNELRLGIEDIPDRKRKSMEWTRTVIRIMQVCPSVEHLDVHGFDAAQQDALVDVLKEKLALVSLRITPNDQPSAQQTPSSLPLFQLMQRWPKLRSLYVRTYTRFSEWDSLPTRPSQSSATFCPDLQELTIFSAYLGESDFRALYAMCDRVPKLALYVENFDRSGRAADVHAVCGGLQAWSRNLESFTMAAHNTYVPRQLFSETLSTLHSLRELEYCGQPFDFGFIAALPQLQSLTFQFVGYTRPEDGLIDCSILEDPEKFPALRLLKYDGIHRPLYDRLVNACMVRNVDGLSGRREGEAWVSVSLLSRFFH